MRQAALKHWPPSVVRSDHDLLEQNPDQPTTLRRLFHAWQREIPQRKPAPTPVDDLGIRRVIRPLRARQTSTHKRFESFKRGSKILTIQEAFDLNYATIRESYVHSFWPPEAIVKFMAAEVVKRERN